MPRSTAPSSDKEAKSGDPLSSRRSSSFRPSPSDAPSLRCYDTADDVPSSSELSDDSEEDLVDNEPGEGAGRAHSPLVSIGARQKGEQVMHSIGKGLLNKVTLRGLHPDESVLLSPTIKQASADPETAHLTDLEAQAATHRKKRGSWWTPLPTAHKVLIVCSVVLCVVLATVGIVVGVVVARRTGERSALEKADPGSQLQADERWIATQGSQAQADLAAPAGPSAEFSSAALGSAHYVGGPLQPLASPVGDSDTNSKAAALYSRFPELLTLLDGNHNWQGNVSKAEPQLLPTLAQGQHPKFAYLGCSDSRVPDSVFAQRPGEIFVTRNVGNEYLVDDLSSETVISYAIAHIGVQHVIVMGHTKCGAVQAAITSPRKAIITNMDETRIDQWIRPIRSLYVATNRTEVVSFREAHHDAETITAEDVTDDVWRAMVEENVKINVQRLAQDASVQHAWYLYEQQPSTQNAQQQPPTSTTTPSAPQRSPHLVDPLRPVTRRSENKKPTELWIHGWVYDVETGLVEDLGVSVGPQGPLER